MELHTEATDGDGIDEEEIAYLDLDIIEWALVVEGLARFGGNPDQATGRQEQAWEIIDVIYEGLGLSAVDILKEDMDIDNDSEYRHTVIGADTEFGAGREDK